MRKHDFIRVGKTMKCADPDCGITVEVCHGNWPNYPLSCNSAKCRASTAHHMTSSG